jgi:hypothetical protein
VDFKGLTPGDAVEAQRDLVSKPRETVDFELAARVVSPLVSRVEAHAPDTAHDLRVTVGKLVLGAFFIDPARSGYVIRRIGANTENTSRSSGIHSARRPKFQRNLLRVPTDLKELQSLFRCDRVGLRVRLLLVRR